MKGIVHKYDRIIIGATIESLLYALFTRTPVFYVVPKVPTTFDTVTIGTSYKILKIFPELVEVVSNKNKDLTRPQKELIWGRLVFLLSILGLMPASNLQAIRIEDNIVKLTTENSRLITLEVDKILLFDDDGIEGLDLPLVENTRYVVKDFIQFNNLKFMDKEYDVIYTDYDTVNQIWFLKSKDKRRKYDGCLISYCENLKDLQDNLTDYNIKFILKEQFKEYNLKGRENGYSDSGKQKHRPVTYKFTERIVQKEKCNVYQNTQYLTFMNYSVQEIMIMFDKIPYREYMLCERLLKISTQRRKSRTSQGSYRLRVKP